MGFIAANKIFFLTLLHPYVWANFAWEDLKDRYKLSVLGVLWVPLSFAIFIGVKVLIFSKLNNASLIEFSIYVTIGYWIWQSTNSLIIDACTCFVRAGGWMKSSDLPYATYVLQSVARNMVPFAVNFIIVLAISSILTERLDAAYLWVIPAFMLYWVTGVWVSYLLGVMSARVRDIQHLVQTMMRVMFFLTPIIWLPDQLGELGKVVSLYNPFAHYIEIVRAPVMEGVTPTLSWMIVGGITIVGWIASMALFASNRAKLVHWI